MQKISTPKYVDHTSPTLAAAQSALADICVPLDDHVAILRTAALALSSPLFNELYGPEPVREASKYSAARLREALGRPKKRLKKLHGISPDVAPPCPHSTV